nr:phage portal protein [uncultured Tyzzerella sp.]
MFYIEKNKELTLDNIKYYIDLFKVNYLPRLTKLNKYYKNDNAINYRVFEDTTKPNNKISHSFGDYIVKTNVAMLLGSPVAYSSEDDLTDYQNILDSANEQDINIDIATNCAKYGYAIQLLYLDDDKNIKFYAIDNKEIILIYADDISEKLLYAIRFWTVKVDSYREIEYIEVYSEDETKLYKNGILEQTVSNLFSSIPIIVYNNNTEKIGDYENVIPLIDEYDLLTSDTANENDYFNNCYLYLNTDSVLEEDIKGMKESRVLYGENLNPQFILKQSSNIDLENEKNRIVKDIHKLSFVPDLSDENFANNVSGVAMKYKLFGTLNNMLNKQRKFKKAINDRNKLIFDMMYTKGLKIPKYVDITFTTSLPVDNMETAQMINMLRGLISDETLASLLPFVQEPKWEIEQANKNRAIPLNYEEE